MVKMERCAAVKLNTLARKKQLKDSKQYESWQLSNLGANIRRYKKRLEVADKLWGIE